MLYIADPFFFPLGSIARSQSRGFGLIFPLSCHSHCFPRIIRQSQSSNLEPMRKYSNQALLSVLATSLCFPTQTTQNHHVGGTSCVPLWVGTPHSPSIPFRLPVPVSAVLHLPRAPILELFLILLLHPPHPIYHQHLLPLSQQSLRSDLLPSPPPPSPSPFILLLLEWHALL